MRRRDPRGDGGDEGAGGGAVALGDRPVPLDVQVGAMTGAAPLGRLRRATVPAGTGSAPTRDERVGRWVERRRLPPGSQVAADPIVPLALSDFHDLRRLGLFDDDGRNPPPGWWAR